MASILKVDQLQLSDGSTPTAADLGLDVSGSVLQVKHSKTYNVSTSTAAETWIQIPIQVDITPKQSTSTFIVVLNYHQQTTNGEQHGISVFLDTGSGYGFLDTSSSYNEVVRNLTGDAFWSMGSQVYSYTPNSSNAFSLRMYHKTRYGGQVRINDSGAGTSLTVYEIAQ